MCGLAGQVRFNGQPVTVETLKGMGDAIAHRGPDGEGYWAVGSVGLVHRRLAIIDLSDAASQPMVSPDGQSVLAYNGEVYNFRELRHELETLGYRFRSTSDTEVVLNALIEWGVGALTRFNGMFALAWWDVRRRSMLLARDRYGIKPLYYAARSDGVAFGSEQKAILALPDFRRRLDHQALIEYFTFQNIFTDRTLIEGVRILPAGHYIHLSQSRGFDAVKPVQYWDFDFREPDSPRDSREYEEELDRLFNAAVSRQLVSDVELGCYLSGGMDSGSIAAVASRDHPYLKTFTCGFDLRSASGLELAFDEREQAEYMSYCFRTEHYEMVLKAGDMERVMPKIAWHLEEPRVGQCYPNFYAAKLASKFVKVVLSGAGGDELFGGYPWRYYRAVVNDDFEHYVDKYYEFWQRLIPNSLLKDVFAPIAASFGSMWTRDIFRDVFQHHASELVRPEDYINHSLYFEAKTFLHGLLVVEDKLSMAHGLESRVPFLDNDLVDFAMVCPVHLKLNNLANVIRINENEPGDKASIYYSRTKDGKKILRDVMQRHIPPEIASAEKQGFSAPDASWFRGESIEFVKRSLLVGDPAIYQLLDRTVVKRLIDEHLTGKTNRRLLIWSLLNVEAWLQQANCELA
ncbi:MAG: asparagine synthase (glutamine-hydrolyzing) [Betaproteobacteria bacterium HGW-Betaproteobacteria-5]|jgi:asparagine synthase (glutamine-hydrolysing)|nr:MAG: asparagine synthase (glutamine-hydrolyzing) [Betaproteobacteria bacterium HGW-Betaproteobacteria-5]PKO30656.1 MAG: asparagine synthase (glutamine-hydrolyzing) [Betaproteobacteria bacterium HGW-Betaproteobacteria-7]